MTEITQSLSSTALAEVAQSAGAQLGAYCGVSTALGFGDTQSEFEAITTSCGVYDLGWRGKIVATGEDRTRWLNGMVTNNIKDLPLNRGNYNFVLNAQGRILGDLYVYNRGNHLLLDTERSQVESLSKVLNDFIIMDEVELADSSEKLTSIGIQGPRAEDLLKQIGLHPDCADPLVVCDLKWEGAPISVTRMANPDYVTYELWLAPETARKLWHVVVSTGAHPVGTAALEKFRVMAGVPRYGQDITERYLPQETEQDEALNFTKGCYIGQEIVERIRARGQVHRTLTGFVLESKAERGAKISHHEKEVGEITSIEAVRPPGGSDFKYLAMGYLRREVSKPGTLVNVGEVSGTVAALPFKF